MTITTSGPTSAASAIVISQMRSTQGAMSAVPETTKRQTTQTGARTGKPATTVTVTSGLAQHPARQPTRKEEGGKPTFPSCARHSRTSASVHKNQRSMKEDNSSRNRQHSKVSDLGAHSDTVREVRSQCRGLPTCTRSASLPRRAAHESRIHTRLGEVHGMPHPTVHHGPLRTPPTDRGRQTSRAGQPSKTACTSHPRARQPWTPRS